MSLWSTSPVSEKVLVAPLGAFAAAILAGGLVTLIDITQRIVLRSMGMQT